MARLTRRRFILAGAAMAFTYLGLGEFLGSNAVITRVNVGLGKNVLFLSDIHLHEKRERSYVIDIVKRIKPHIVIIGGDLWDERSHSLRNIIGFLNGLRRLSKASIMVLGNHEYWSSSRFSLNEVVKDIEDMGILVLRDETTEAEGLRIAGLDWKENPKHYEAVAKRLRGADLFVAHSPDVFPYISSRDARVVAGHTHGGQICLPGNTSLTTNSVYGYKWGLYRSGSKVLYVSRGLGEMYPPRLYCRREAVLLY